MPRGRTFDTASAVDAAIDLFWSRGFAGVSMQDIAEATGVGNGSLYLAFGSKRALFLAAFRAYCERRVAFVRSAVASPAASPDDVLARYFAAVVDDCAGDLQRRGCLLINSIAELGHEAPIAEIADDTLARMVSAVAEALEAASPADGGRSDTVRAAEQAVTVSQSLILVSRLGRSRDELERSAQDSAAMIAQAVRAA